MIAASPVAAALGRPERMAPLGPALAELAGKRILVTGSAGSIGSALLGLEDLDVQGADLMTGVDVRDAAAVAATMRVQRPDVVIHLAGAKSAPGGESDPWGVAETNVAGTRNVLEAAAAAGARVVTASTCKACDPETAYGASKLIAERMTLNAGGTVARFHNVVETSGNVFELWRETPDDEPLTVTSCSRYFISLAEAVALVLWSAILPAGRYATHPGARRRMYEVAADLYPARRLTQVPPRRGDRLCEPLVASHERWEWVMPHLPFIRIRSSHDGEPA